jgi:hypothetical protein
MKMIKVVMVMTVLALAAKVSLATNLLWPGTSKPALIAYARQSVVRAMSSVNSDGGVMMSSYMAYDAEGNFDRLAASLRTNTVNFIVADPAVDKVSVMTTLLSEEGYPLFMGGNYTGLENTPTGWQVPSWALNTHLDLYWRIPIAFDNVTSANVIRRDAQGNIVGPPAYLETSYDEDLVWFETQYTGQSGETVVHTYDQATGQSGTFIFALDQMMELPLENVSAGVNFSVNGMITAPTNSTYVFVNPQSQNGYGEVPLVILQLTKALTVKIRMVTTENEKAVAVQYRVGKTDDWITLSTDQDGAVSIPLGVGEVEFIPVFPKFGKPSVGYGVKG